jgi:hypothetical protein
MRVFIVAIGCCVLLAACGKKDAEAPVEPVAGGDAPARAEKSSTAAAPKSQQASPAATANELIEQGKYDEAIALLVKTKEAAQTEQARFAFKGDYIDAQQALLRKAETDPKAKQAWNDLGRLMMGR